MTTPHVSVNGCYITTNSNIPAITVNSSYSTVTNTAPTMAADTDGNLVVTGRLVVNGVDLLKTVNDLSELIGYVANNKELLEKYAGLKEAAEQYREVVDMYQTHNMLDSPYGE